MIRRPSASATDDEDDGVPSAQSSQQPSSSSTSTTAGAMPRRSNSGPSPAHNHFNHTHNNHHLGSTASPEKTLNPPSEKYLHPKPKRKNSRPADPPSSLWKRSSSNANGRGEVDHRESNGSLKSTKPLMSSSPTTEASGVSILVRSRWRNPWAMSWLSMTCLLTAAVLLLGVYQSFTFYQLDPKGGSMSYMSSAFVKFPDFDTEHTRFATKYSLYLYREVGVDEDSRVSIPRQIEPS
jgi:hypothetical protein